MLDDEQARLTGTGTVTINSVGVGDTGVCILIEGFEAANATCRDLAVLATVWAIGELQRELMKTLEHPGGGNIGIN